MFCFLHLRTPDQFCDGPVYFLERIENRRHQMEEELKTPEERAKEGLNDDQDENTPDVRSSVRSSIELKKTPAEDATAEKMDEKQSGADEAKTGGDAAEVKVEKSSDEGEENAEASDSGDEQSVDADPESAGKREEELEKSLEEEEKSDDDDEKNSEGSSDED